MALLLLLLLLLSLLSTSHPSSLLDTHPAPDPCNNVTCGHGRCLNHTVLLGTLGYYSCQCDPGWTSPFDLSFAPCVIPNCTLYQSCDDRNSPTSPPASAPPPAASSPTIFNVCSFSVCGNGKCTSQSLLSYTCECDPGSSNIFNSSSGYCLKECQIGADCSNLGISIGQNSSKQAPTPPSTSQGFIKNRLHGGFMFLPGLLMWAIWR